MGAGLLLYLLVAALSMYNAGAGFAVRYSQLQRNVLYREHSRRQQGLVTFVASSFTDERRPGSAASAPTRLSATPATTTATTPSTPNAGFYIHIPYCRQRCRYCDFAIVPIGNTTTNNKDVAMNTGFAAMDLAYREALLQELDLIALGTTSTTRATLSSIYFGGGTPSLAPVETIQAVLEKLKEHFSFAADIEITMEMDPGTFDEAQLTALVNECGINRVSLGVQSLQNNVLQHIGRVHRVNDIHDAVSMLQSFGDRLQYSMDLISGLPGVSLADWADTLENVVRDFRPNHLSIYDLQVEQGTVFGKWYPNADLEDESGGSRAPSPAAAATMSFITNDPACTLTLPSPNECAYMYKYASGYLRHKGFEHYEISSYAAPTASSDGKATATTQRSVHNQVYWAYETAWYATGLGATSFLENHRFARPRAMADYISWVTNMATHQNEKLFDWLPVPQAEANEEGKVDADRLTDVILTRLRTKDGLDLKWLESTYSQDIVDSVVRGAELGLEMGLAQLVEDEHAKLLRLVDPKGFLFSNYIISSIFVELGVEDDDE
jgi:coproporphyrinogen III oxidase-like Fe-S oxidoreductase